jgi:hypothetical protein
MNLNTISLPTKGKANKIIEFPYVKVEKKPPKVALYQSPGKRPHQKPHPLGPAKEWASNKVPKWHLKQSPKNGFIIFFKCPQFGFK